MLWTFVLECLSVHRGGTDCCDAQG